MGEQEKAGIQESIRQGKAPAIVKRRAARGSLPVATDEMLEILVFLTGDPDPTCSEVAKDTLKSWTLEKMLPIVAQPHIHDDTLAFVAAREDLPEDMVEKLTAHPNAGDKSLTALARRLKVPQLYQLLPDHDKALLLPNFVKAVLTRKDLPSDLQQRLEGALPRDDKKVGTGAGAAAGKEKMSVTQKLQKMGVAEKIAYCPKAEREAILILIRDPAKLVYRAALTSPKLGDAEAETIAAMKNVSDEVLRAMGTNRKWLKNRVVIKNLANNPRTPIDVSLSLLKMLTKHELKEVSANRNVAEIVKKTATKMMKAKM